jgi:hypothetical protein
LHDKPQQNCDNRLAGCALRPFATDQAHHGQRAVMNQGIVQNHQDSDLLGLLYGFIFKPGEAQFNNCRPSEKPGSLIYVATR